MEEKREINNCPKKIMNKKKTRNNKIEEKKEMKNGKQKKWMNKNKKGSIIIEKKRIEIKKCLKK